MSNMHRAQHTSFAGAVLLPALQRASNSERAQELCLQAPCLLKGYQAATLWTYAVHHVQLTVPYLQARLVTSSVAGTDAKAPEGTPAGAQRSGAASGSVSVVALRGEILQWRLLAVNRGQHWLWHSFGCTQSLRHEPALGWTCWAPQHGVSNRKAFVPCIRLQCARSAEREGPAAAPACCLQSGQFWS